MQGAEVGRAFQPDPCDPAGPDRPESGWKPDLPGARRRAGGDWPIPAAAGGDGAPMTVTGRVLDPPGQAGARRRGDGRRAVEADRPAVARPLISR